VTLLLAVVAGALIGLSLGELGGGGSILAVPVLVFLLDQDAGQATTGSLVVVGVTSLIGAVTAHRASNVMLGRGVTFGVVAIGGAAAGAKASAHVADSVLLAAFAALMLVVGGLMALRQIRHAHQSRHASPGHPNRADRLHPRLEDPIIAFREGFMCDCPRAVKVLATATVVGLLTGFLGVGGGFLVVPALVLALALPMSYAVGTSLVVITLTSAAALAVRVGTGTTPDWALVAALTAASAVGGIVGARLADRIDTTRLSAAFTVLVLGVAIYTTAQALPALI
jgi:uncharacterized membrane protein YfcA